MKTIIMGFITIFPVLRQFRKIGYFTPKADFCKTVFISNFALVN